MPIAQRSQFFQPVIAGSWPPVPLSMANPAEGDFRNSDETDGALANYNPSTNGICEYTASNFDGAMQGDLLMAGFDGTTLRLQKIPVSTMYWILITRDWAGSRWQTCRIPGGITQALE